MAILCGEPMPWRCHRSLVATTLTARGALLAEWGQTVIDAASELDAGLDPDDPVVREAAEAGVRSAADELGLG